jgi:hypothetical protein
MALEYRYAVYNPGQYADDVARAWDEMVADGWQIHTAAPNYAEISILWQRELPKGGRRRRADGDSAVEQQSTPGAPAPEPGA